MLGASASGDTSDLGPKHGLLLLLYAVVFMGLFQFGLQFLVLLHKVLDFLLVSLLQRLYDLLVLIPEGQEMLVSLLDLSVVLVKLKLQGLGLLYLDLKLLLRPLQFLALLCKLALEGEALLLLDCKSLLVFYFGFLKFSSVRLSRLVEFLQLGLLLGKQSLLLL